VILGGTGAISEPVATELGKLGGGGWHAPKPERIEGVDRYDTAGKVAAQVTSGTPGHLAFVASGEGFADALSASAVAARLGAPVLLTRRASVPPKTAAALMRMTALQRIVVAGGEGVVQQATIDAATGDASITVAAGADRYVTSREVARLGMTLTGEPGTLPGTRSVLFVATGRTYADAVAAAPAAAAGGGSLVLTDDVIAGELAAWIAPENLPAADSFHGAVHHVTMMGGLGVLSQGTEDLLRGAVQPLP
jgi:putative cell wall-binding protein